MINGKPEWGGSNPIWAKVGALDKQAGLEWAGEWHFFKELAHFQYTGGLMIAQLKSRTAIS